MFFKDSSSDCGGDRATSSTVGACDICDESVYSQMEIQHRQHLNELANRYPQLDKLRAIGTIWAIDINNQEKAGYLNNVGRKIGHQATALGVLLCLLGNVLYLMPPYGINESEFG
jgi:adenosylmethionine---8-amino-7-oxononanoate aminotransferase